MADEYSRQYKEKYDKYFQKKFQAKRLAEEKAKAEKLLNEKSKRQYKPLKEIKKVEKEFKRFERELEEEIQLNKKWIIIGSVILIILILGSVYLLIPPTEKTKFNPLDVVTTNSTGMPMNIYYKDNPLLLISGWESKLTYSNKEDRLFGNKQYKKIIYDDKKAYTYIIYDDQIRIEPLTTDPNQATIIGWFTNQSQITFNEKSTFLTKKNVNASIMDGEGEIKNANFNYNFYKNKPYFKTQIFVKSENYKNLGNFAYGIVLKDYDIYLSNGTILFNDNKITDLNKPVNAILFENGKTTENISPKLKQEVLLDQNAKRNAIERSGTNYANIVSDYEIFINKDKTRTIIVYSPNTLYFNNLFLWNVFQAYVPNLGEGVYPPLYFMVVENPKLTYHEDIQDWRIKTDSYSGTLKSYIDKNINEINKNN